MKIKEILYTNKTASKEELFSCLSECSQIFIPPLDTRVSIRGYAKKIFEKSITFEAWLDQQLLGFVAGYFNDVIRRSAFITNVSVIKKYQGLRIASKLLAMCIDYAKKNNFREVELKVNKRNISAIELYKKFNFRNVEKKEDIITMKRELV